MMSSNAESRPAATPLLSPTSLLPSRWLNSLLSVPPALSVLHCLAQKSVLHGRWEEPRGAPSLCCLLQLLSNLKKKPMRGNKYETPYSCFSRVMEGVEYFLDLLASLHSDDQQRVRLHTHTGINISLFGSDTVSPSLYSRYMLNSLPSRGCLSSTWRRVLPCSWPSGLLIAWRCATRSSVWRWSCCQRSWCWRKRRNRVKLELLIQRRRRGWGWYCGLELPTCSRVTVTHIWETRNRLWLTTRGVWGEINVFMLHMWLETQGCALLSRCINLLVRVFFKHRGEHFAGFIFFEENVPMWPQVPRLLIVCSWFHHVQAALHRSRM